MLSTNNIYKISCQDALILYSYCQDIIESGEHYYNFTDLSNQTSKYGIL